MKKPILIIIGVFFTVNLFSQSRAIQTSSERVNL